MPQCAGKSFYPSNGTEGMIFTDSFCDQCLHEKFTHTQNENDASCNILMRTMVYSPKDTEYPREWIYNAEGWPTCTKWQKWDWGKDDDGNWNDPPKPGPDDPAQLLMPFDIWELLGVSDDIIVTKTAVVEKELFEI